MFETGQRFHMIRCASASPCIGVSLSLAAAIPASRASDILVGRAVLPAGTFAEGQLNALNNPEFLFACASLLSSPIDEITFINTSFDRNRFLTFSCQKAATEEEKRSKFLNEVF